MKWSLRMHGDASTLVFFNLVVDNYDDIENLGCVARDYWNLGYVARDVIIAFEAAYWTVGLVGLKMMCLLYTKKNWKHKYMIKKTRNKEK